MNQEPHIEWCVFYFTLVKSSRCVLPNLFWVAIHVFRYVLGPADKGNRPAVGMGEAEGESQEDLESQQASSPLKRTSLRAPAVESMAAFSRR